MLSAQVHKSSQEAFSVNLAHPWPAGWQKLASFRQAQKMPSILSSDAYLLIRDKKNVVFFRVLPKLQQKGSFYLVLPSFYLVLLSFYLVLPM